MYFLYICNISTIFVLFMTLFHVYGRTSLKLDLLLTVNGFFLFSAFWGLILFFVTFISAFLLIAIIIHFSFTCQECIDFISTILVPNICVKLVKFFVCLTVKEINNKIA